MPLEIKWPKDWKTWIGVVGLLGLAIYQASTSQYEMAWGSLMAALTMLGIGGRVESAAMSSALAATQAHYAAKDTALMRDNPATPFLPLSPAEASERHRNTNPKDAN